MRSRLRKLQPQTDEVSPLGPVESHTVLNWNTASRGGWVEPMQLKVSLTCLEQTAERGAVGCGAAGGDGLGLAALERESLRLGSGRHYAQDAIGPGIGTGLLEFGQQRSLDEHFHARCQDDQHAHDLGQLGQHTPAVST